jgi:Cof subfamily protein (haloacid dehalogenase superfamily)
LWQEELYLKASQNKLKNGISHPLFDLIAIDCDGTLLDSNGDLSIHAPEAIKKAQELGIKIALVTGRSQSTLEFIFKRLDIKGPFIGSGGAFIGDLATGEVIQQRTLPKSEVETLIRLCREFDLILFLDHSSFMLCEKENEKTRQHKKDHGYTWKIVPDLLQELSDLPEKGLVVGDPQKLAELFNYYQDNAHEVSITFTSPTSMDILPKGVSKGNALMKLAEHLRIKPERIVVIGDYLNDLEMFKVAGTSIAMGNAPQEVKQAADRLAPSNDESGVAWAINELLGLAQEDG